MLYQEDDGLVVELTHYISRPFTLFIVVICCIVYIFMQLFILFVIFPYYALLCNASYAASNRGQGLVCEQVSSMEMVLSQACAHDKVSIT